jgi:hypothetical protein
MVWKTRLLFVLPLVAAGLLNIVAVFEDQFHLNREHVAGYIFLFFTPWAWLLERSWFPNVQSGWAHALIGYVVLLWIPAFLYSGTIWLLLRAASFRRHS